MNTNKEQESLKRALEAQDLANLPKVEDGESVWLKALAKVGKRDGSIGYVCVVRDGGDVEKTRIVADYGEPCAIAKFIEFYPITYMKASYMPTFESKNSKEERVAYLMKANPELDEEMLMGLSLKELNKMVKENAANRQMKVEKNLA